MAINNEIMAKAKEAKSPEELMALAKENGIDITKEIANEYFGRLHPALGELSHDELDNVSGGGCYSDGGRLKTTSGYKCKNYADGQSTYGIKGTCCRYKYWGVDPNAVCGSLWTTLIELIIKAAEAAEPRECYHPANSKKG